MRIKYQSILFLIFACFTQSFASPPKNLSCTKAQIERYYDGGGYERDINRITKNALSYLEKTLIANRYHRDDAKLAIVLDIDDTALSSYHWYKKHDFKRDQADIIQSCQEAIYPAIKPVLFLYKFAIRHGIHVFFVTARPKGLEKATVLNLNREGYSDWDEIFYISDVQTSKSAIRKKIVEAGYHILLNMGDQKSDLVGGYAEWNVKLPNPLYCSTYDCK